MRFYLERDGKYFSMTGWGALSDAHWYDSQREAGAAIRKMSMTRPKMMERAQVRGIMPEEGIAAQGVIGNTDPFSGF
jgi:hypothetical protein